MIAIFHTSRIHRKDSFIRFFCGILPMLVLVFAFANVVRADSATAKSDSGEQLTLDAFEKRVTALGRPRLDQIEDANRLNSMYDEVKSLESQLNIMIQSLFEGIAGVDANLKSLGPAAPDTDPKAVARERRKLEGEKKTLEGEHAAARLALLNLEQIGTAINKRQKQLAAEHWWARGAPVWKSLPIPISVFKDVSARLAGAAEDLTSLVSADRSGLWYLALASILILVWILLYKILQLVFRHGQWTIDLASQSAGAALLALRHYLAPLLLLVAAYISVDFDHAELAAQTLFSRSFGLLVAGLSLLFVTRVAIWPVIPGLPSVGINEPTRLCLYRRLRALVVTGVLGRVLLEFGAIFEIPGAVMDPLNDLWVVALVILVFLLSRRLPAGAWPFAGLQGLIALFLLCVLGASLLGYRNFALDMLRSGGIVVIAFALAWFGDRLVKNIFEGLVAARGGLRRHLRSMLGLRGGATWPGLSSFIRVIRALVWLGVAALALEALNVPRPILTMLDQTLNQGFVIGQLKVVPMRLLLAVLSFAVLYVFFGWLRLNMDKRWLPASRMSGSAREATVTLTGYAGLALAVLVALSVAGATFTNLAIVAGALSVGIGFGLQNIVNNFISGLILLFERPIKTGDWVVVNNTEGYVRKISIRSTHIETFDKSDVIVPNSDLISNQVTNWMYSNKIGRVRVPVGVAYGTDVEKVREILTQIALQHEKIVHDDNKFPIRVLFMEFGDSALLFELRCFVKNVDNRLRVRSEMNFAIDAAFREAGVQIPFPQRDVHLHYQDRSGQGDGTG